MQKFFKILGMLVLTFLLVSNHIDIVLSDGNMIVLAILGSIFWSVGIIMEYKK